MAKIQLATSRCKDMERMLLNITTIATPHAPQIVTCLAAGTLQTDLLSARCTITTGLTTVAKRLIKLSLSLTLLRHIRLEVYT